jgi:hypothetical protein
METLAILHEQTSGIEQEIERLVKERSAIPYKIPLSQMPQESRYNKLSRESKHLQNILKMICFRAETALAGKLAPHFARSRDEIRALVKSIIMLTIDLYPDYQNNKIEITLYPLTNKRSNYALESILHIINQTNTKYPGTDLTLFYKITTV